MAHNFGSTRFHEYPYECLPFLGRLLVKHHLALTLTLTLTLTLALSLAQLVGRKPSTSRSKSTSMKGHRIAKMADLVQGGASSLKSAYGRTTSR